MKAWHRYLRSTTRSHSGFLACQTYGELDDTSPNSINLVVLSFRVISSMATRSGGLTTLTRHTGGWVLPEATLGIVFASDIQTSAMEDRDQQGMEGVIIFCLHSDPLSQPGLIMQQVSVLKFIHPSLRPLLHHIWHPQVWKMYPESWNVMITWN